VAAADVFVIDVVDEGTGRGVPLVELQTVAGQRFYTDSAGVAAISDPVLMGQKVHFAASSFGYQGPKDGLGIEGVVLNVKPGGSAKISMKRINIAERLYRVTGAGIYRDTVLAGRTAPIAQPLIDAQVAGQDSVQSIVYGGKIYFFWGDTSRLSYPLGLFKTAGATSELPGKGGLDPSVGVNLKYFAGADGFARAMAPREGPGVVWIDGVLLLNDEHGRQRMYAQASTMQSLIKRLSRDLMVFDDASQTFVELKKLELDPPMAPSGHPFLVNDGGTNYYYFPQPYPSVRVKADLKSWSDLNAYEGYTPLKLGTKTLDEKNPQWDRDARGQLKFAWKRGTPPLTREQSEALIKAGKLRREQLPGRLIDADGGKAVALHAASVEFNAYRKKWVLIGVETGGSSMLGEVWYAESARPEGPWIRARKIATHHKETGGALGKTAENMDFYNPRHHPFFDQEGGRIIYFEGTYTKTFSGYPVQTPLYEYNQLMYRLDLSDPRLKLD
jgi:hypothetical protein